MHYGSYKGVIKSEAVYKCTNKDDLPKAAEPSTGLYVAQAFM